MNLQGDKKNALVKLLAKITILLSILFFVLILVLILHPDYSIIRISIFLLLILLIYLGFFTMIISELQKLTSILMKIFPAGIPSLMISKFGIILFILTFPLIVFPASFIIIKFFHIFLLISIFLILLEVFMKKSNEKIPLKGFSLFIIIIGISSIFLTFGSKLLTNFNVLNHNDIFIIIQFLLLIGVLILGTIYLILYLIQFWSRNNLKKSVY